MYDEVFILLYDFPRKCIYLSLNCLNDFKAKLTNLHLYELCLFVSVLDFNVCTCTFDNNLNMNSTM